MKVAEGQMAVMTLEERMEQLGAAIAALEASRALLGDGVVEVALGALRHWSRPLQDPVQFAPIQPGTATVLTVIDFDPLSLGHDKLIFNTHGALHHLPPLK